MSLKGKKKEFVKLFHKKAGNISATCDAVQINRQTYYNWLDADDKFKASIEDINERLIDYTESKLMQCIDSNNITSIIFMLKTKGKSRGYVEKAITEHQGQVTNKNIDLTSLSDDKLDELINKLDGKSKPD